MRKKFLLMTFLTLLFTAMGTSVLRAQGNVAKVGDTEYAKLADAVNAAQADDEIKVIANIATNLDLTISKKVTLDLGGFTLSDAGIKIASDVTIKNGKIVNTNEPYPLKVTGSGNLTVDGVAIEASKSDRAIWLDGSSSVLNFKSGSSILATKGTNNTYSKIYGVWVSQGATANIYGGTITVDAGANATAVAIFGNYDNNTVNIYGGKISTSGKNYSYAVYVYGDVTITGGEIVTNEEQYGYSSGITYGFNYAIYSKGDVEISGDTKITTYGHSGYIVNAGGSNQEVVITGGEFTNVLSEIDKTAGGHSAPNLIYGSSVAATIEGGDFNGYNGEVLIKGTGSTLTITGGSFDNMPKADYVAVGATITVGETTYTKTEDGLEVVIPVASVNGTSYTTLADALSAASAMTGDVTVEIYEKVTLNQSLSGSYSSIKFVGKDTDAEIYLDVQGYITATGKEVAFEDLKLSKSPGGFITNAGFMNVAFGVYDVTEVTYTNCVFANGAYASSGNVTYTGGCIFKRSHDKYGLWAYGNVDITVDGCTFDDYRGIKMYAEGAAKTVDLTVKNTDFSAVDNKPAIVLTYGESVTLENNTYSSTGVFELDLDGAPNGTPINYTDDNDEKLTCKNDNGPCGVLVNDKIYTTVAQAAEVATSGSTVTLLHDSAETVVLPMGVILDKNGHDADGVTVAEPIAKIGENVYTTLEAAFEAATEGQTITLLADATPALTSQRAITKAAVIDLGGKTLTLTEDDLYFGTTEFKNGYIIVDPSVKPSTAVFWMFANQTLTFDNVKIVATGVTGTYLIGLDGNNSDLNILNGSEIIVNNATALDLDIICVNASTGNDIVVDNSKVNVKNLDGRVFFRGNYTIKGNSDIDLDGITKAGFRIEAGQTLSIEDNATVDIIGEPRDGGIHLTDLTATYTVAETATVNATVSQPVAVAQIGTTKYGTLQAAVADVQEGQTIQLLAGEISEGTIKLPATLKNVTFIGAANHASVLKDMTIMAADGNSFNYEGLTFDGIYFNNSRISLTGWRNGDETIKDLTVTNCWFKNLDDTTNSAPLHINKDAYEAVNGLTFTNNVIDGATGGSKSGVYAQTTGVVVFTGNIINNVSFRPYIIQLTTDDGVADTFTVTDNTFSGSAAGRAQGLGNNAVGTDAVSLTISNNIFKDITAAQQICYYNFNEETTTAVLEKNYYDIDIVANPSKIYFNNAAADKYELSEMGVFPIYRELNEDGTINTASAYTPELPIAQIGETGYETLAAAAEAAQAGDIITLCTNVTENVNLPADITFNGNGKQINGSITAAGNLIIAGHTKATSFNAGYNKPIITIGAGACLEMNGTGRMVIGHGATFNITGNITDAKTANVAELTPSLIMPGASFTGAGVTFNVTNAYISAPSSYCSSSSSASGTFDFNITNSIWESAGKLAFEAQSTAATVNFELKDSELTTGSHLVFGVSRGEVVFDNSNVNVGTSRQIENRSTMTIKNGAVVNGAVATSSNAINPGTIIVENATYAVTGEFSGAAEGTGTLIFNKSANVSVGSIKAGANVVVDAEGMAAGDNINFTADLSQFTGTLSVINNDNLEAKIVGGKIVLVEKPVAKIGETEYATLQAAVDAAQDGEEIDLLKDVELTSTLLLTKNNILDGNGFMLTPAEGFTYDGNNAVIVLAANMSGYEANRTYTVKNLTIKGFSTPSRIVRANFCDATIQNCLFDNNTSESIITSAYAVLNVEDNTFENNTASFAVINVGSDVSDGTNLVAKIIDNTFENNQAAIAGIFLASSADVTDNHFNANTHTGDNDNAAAILAGPYTGNMAYTVNINRNAFENAMSKDGTPLPSVFAEDWSSLGSTTSFDLSLNYWDGNEPEAGTAYKTSGDNPQVTVKSYYTTYTDGTLGGLVELPQGNNFTGYTGVDAIWGEVWGNASESFVIKVLDSIGIVMGTTSLNNVDGIIDGDVNVTWNIKLDAASNTDEYWTMAWTAAPNINNMPAKVELWVDGYKVSGGPVVLNGPDNLNPIYAAVTDADGKILSYHTSIAAAVDAAQQGNTIALLRDTDEEIKLPFGVTLNLNGFDAPNVTFTLPTAMIGETEYASVADALVAAQAANLADVVITIIGENTAATADNFSLIYENKFDKVTFKQNNGGKVYYFNELYTGSRTNNGEFVFDGVNLVVTGQYMFEGNVKLSNNSFVKSTAEANCFVYYAEVTVEAGSKIDGVIEDIRGGSLIIDGGKTDGTYCSEPGLRDAILTVNWTSSNLVLKNGAYVKVNSANEVGRLTVNGEMRVTDSKLESYQWILVKENATLTLNAGSDITTQKVNGAGNIIVDVTGLEGQATVIKGDMTGFTGTITVDRGFYTVTADGLVVERGLSGKGTEAEPYLITDADELHLFRNSVNAGETRYNTSDVWVVLDADIDLDVTRSASNWEPIGTFDYSFDGNFDGKGHIIKNLKIYDNTTAANGEAYLGFFGVTANNTIKNFVIENVTIESEGQIVAAAIAYPYYTEVSDITVKGDIKIKGGNYTAGVLAYTRLCQNASNLTVSGNEDSYIEGAQTVGGVIADIQMNHGLVANYSNFTAEGLTIKGTKSVGGISGIIAAQTLNGATVNNVTLNCEDDRVGIVSGALGGASTITNVTVENVTGATNIVGATYDGAKPIAAKIGDTYYGTLANALAADGEESVELLAPITIAVGETVVYNLNGKTVVATDNATGNYAMITNKGNLTIEGEGKLQLTATNNRGWSAYSSVISNTVGGKLTVNGGTIEHLGGTDMAYAIDNLTNGQGTYAETVINGGTMKSTYRAIRQFLNGEEAHNIFTVNGGIIEGINKSIWMQDPSANANTGTLTVGVDAKLVGDAYLTVTAGSTEWPVEVAIAAAALQGESTVLTSNVPENYIVKNNNGVWGVFSAVASVNGVNYATLQEAVAAVEDGGTITLIANETFTENNRYNNGGWWDGLGYSGDKSFTIDLANFTISQDGALNDYLMWFKNDGAKANTITLKNGTLNAGTTAYCALATASSNAQKITINTENIEFIGNNSNGAVLKIRGGAELNVNADTKITGKNSYVGIESYDATVNIYDGAEIYQNGTSSYNGCLVGVSGNGTVNVYGGYGKGVSGGFIAMTSGGTINVAGGEWIANTDGTYANGNKSVLVAQSANGASSIVNVTGGIFRGGYNCYGAAVGDAQINISGGNFNADPSAYVDDNYYKVVPKNDGTFDVIQIAGTQTRSLQAGWNWFSSYVDLSQEGGLLKLQTALGESGLAIKGQTENQSVQYVKIGVVEGEEIYAWTGNQNWNPYSNKMYMIKTSKAMSAEEFGINGDFIDYENTTIALFQGWNWISYPLNEPALINEALAELDPTQGDQIKFRGNTFAEFYNGKWYPEDFVFMPGEGYMYKAESPNSFVYTKGTTNVSTNKTDENNNWMAQTSEYANNMTITAMLSIDGEIVKGNYEVAAFANGECRGSARPIYIEAIDAYVLYMTIYGDEVEELTFMYYDIDKDTEYELSNVMNYSNDAIVGTLSDPYIFSMNILGIGENSIDNINIYPNPTTTDREINLQATCDKVEVFNALGVKVAEYHNVDTLDALETAGIYVIRITNDNAVKHCRLVVK